MISGLGHELANPINTTSMCLEELNEEVLELTEKIMPLFDDSPEAMEFREFLDKKFESIATTKGRPRPALRQR